MIVRLMQRAGRVFAVIVLGAAFSVVSLNASYAGSSPPSPPAATPLTASDRACDPAIRAAIENRANAVRIGHQAIAVGSIPPPEPAAGLTCMDQAIAVSARSGAIFSDVHEDSIPPANTIVFTPELAFSDAGLGDFLLTNLNNTVTPMLGNWVNGNFGSDMVSALGMNVISSKLTGLVEQIMEPINTITSTINGFSGQINSIMQAINTIQTLAKALNLPMPSPLIIGAVGALEAAQQVANQLIRGVQSAMNAAVQPLIGQVMSEIMAPTADMDCDNMQKVWNDSNPNNNAKSLQGDGPSADVPLLNMPAALAGLFNEHEGPHGTNFKVSTNSIDIYERALEDKTTGILSKPVSNAPACGMDASSKAVVNAMKGGGCN